MPPDDPEKKVCPYCSKMTSIHANFCYFCARELVARPERPMEESKPGRINWVAVGVVVAVVVVVGLLLALR